MFTAKYERAGPCKGCKRGCPYAQIALTLTGTGNYRDMERATMFAIAAGHGRLPEKYSEELNHEGVKE
jgi:hypothetical protein